MSHDPYYAIGFRLTSADADTVLIAKSYQVVAVRYENMLFGHYYYGGKMHTINAAGQITATKVYPTTIRVRRAPTRLYADHGGSRRRGDGLSETAPNRDRCG